MGCVRDRAERLDGREQALPLLFRLHLQKPSTCFFLQSKCQVPVWVLHHVKNGFGENSEGKRVVKSVDFLRAPNYAERFRKFKSLKHFPSPQTELLNKCVTELVKLTAIPHTPRTCFCRAEIAARISCAAGSAAGGRFGEEALGAVPFFSASASATSDSDTREDLQ